MTDERRLQDKLSKLAASAEHVGINGRALSSVSGAGLLGAILQEIDETILARQLTFENDKGASVTIEVANRRLLRLSKLSDASELKSFTKLLDRPIVDAAGSNAVALGAMFNAFLAGAKTVHVTASKSTSAHDAAEIGCSVNDLATAWRVGLYGEKPQDTVVSLAPFVGYCQDLSLAWILEDQNALPEKGGQSGDLDLLEAMAKFRLSLNISLLSDASQDQDPPYCVIMSNEIPMQRSIIYVKTGTARLFCLISNAELAAVVSAWHRRD